MIYHIKQVLLFAGKHKQLPTFGNKGDPIFVC